MLAVSDAQLNAWLAQFLWPLARILAVLATAPLFNESAIPRLTKIGLAVMMTVALAPALSVDTRVPVASLDGLLILAQQIIVGIAMGFTMRLAFAAVQMAGELVGLQMGLSFATFFDPGTGANTAVISRLLNVLAVLVFIGVDGHLMMLAALALSFEAIPLAPLSLQIDGWGVVIEQGAMVFTSGVLLALPMIAALLAINLALGILNRSAPQLSVFSVGFPISLSVGLIVLVVVLPNTLPFMETLFRDSFSAISRFAQVIVR